MKIENPTDKLSFKKIFIYWYPMSLTWFMIAAENPFLAAMIARLGEPKFNLAAFGVAYSFGLIMEAPVIMITSASTALVKCRQSYYKLRRFTMTLNLSVSVIMILGLLPPVFYYVTEDLIGLPSNVAYVTHITSILLIPWPASIGYRRFFEGILIRSNATRLVAYGTIIRLVTMAVTAVVLYLFKVQGAYIGASALSMGVVLQAAAARIMASDAIKALPEKSRADQNGDDEEKKTDAESELTYKGIFKFYYPLALVTIMALGIHPFVTFFIGKSRMALESLAILPVINPLIFMFRSVGLSFTEVSIALLGENNKNYLQLRNFALVLGICTVGLLSLISFTPMLSFYFQEISGLPAALSELSHLPTYLMVLLPGLTILISLQRSVLINQKTTRLITYGTMIEVTMIFASLMILVLEFNFIGAVAAAFAFTFGRLCNNLFLFPHQLKATRNSR